MPLGSGDVRGAPDQFKKLTAGRRDVGADASEIEPEIRVDLVALGRGDAGRELIDIKVDAHEMGAGTPIAGSVRDGMPRHDGGKGVPPRAPRIKAGVALQHREQDVLTQVIPIAAREVQPACASTGIAIGDGEAGSEAARIPGVGLGRVSKALRSHDGLRRRAGCCDAESGPRAGTIR